MKWKILLIIIYAVEEKLCFENASIDDEVLSKIDENYQEIIDLRSFKDGACEIFNRCFPQETGVCGSDDSRPGLCTLFINECVMQQYTCAGQGMFRRADSVSCCAGLTPVDFYGKKIRLAALPGYRAYVVSTCYDYQKMCSATISYKLTCTVDIRTGHIRHFTNLCLMMRSNCMEYGLYTMIDISECRKPHPYEGPDVDGIEKFVNLTCDRVNKCTKDLQEPTLTCYMNLHNKRTMWVKSRCAIFERNCFQEGLYLRVNIANCVKLQSAKSPKNNDKTTEDPRSIKKGEYVARETVVTDNKAVLLLAIAKLACKSSKQCIAKDISTPICGTILHTGRHLIFANVCQLLKYNCEETGKNLAVLSTVENCKLDAVSLETSVSGTAQKAETSSITTNFLKYACDSYKACSAMENKANICTVDLSNGNFKTFKDVCSALKDNCEGKKMLLLAAEDDCNPLRTPSSTITLSSLYVTRSEYEAGSAIVENAVSETEGKNLISEEACKLLKTCSDNSTVCALNNNNDTYIRLPSVCKIFEINCAETGLLTWKTLDHCKTGEIITTTTFNPGATDPIVNKMTDILCNFARTCDRKKHTSKVCGLQSENGTLLEFQNLCDLLQMNCDLATLFFSIEVKFCKPKYGKFKAQLENVVVPMNPVTPKIEGQEASSFSNQACATWRECTLAMNNEEICAMNFIDGKHYIFENKCLMLKHNCEQSMMLFAVESEKCSHENIPYMLEKK